MKNPEPIYVQTVADLGFDPWLVPKTPTALDRQLDHKKWLNATVTKVKAAKLDAKPRTRKAAAKKAS